MPYCPVKILPDMLKSLFSEVNPNDRAECLRLTQPAGYSDTLKMAETQQLTKNINKNI